METKACQRELFQGSLKVADRCGEESLHRQAGGVSPCLTMAFAGPQWPDRVHGAGLAQDGQGKSLLQS